MESISEIFKFLKGHALAVLGLIAFIIATNAATHLGLNTLTFGWQIALAVVGIILIGFDLWLVIKGISAEEKELQKDYKIEIHSPKVGNKVSSPISLRGTLKKQPKSVLLYTFEYNHMTSLYYPKSELIYEPGTTNWSCSIKIGGGDDKERTIVIAAVGKSGKYFIDYYQKVAGDTNHQFYVGVRQLPPNIVIKKDVTIWLNKQLP